MKLEKLMHYIDPAKLPWDYQELIEIVGLEKTLEIAARVGGTYMYMEKLDTILMPAKRACVLDEFKNSEGMANVRQIARDIELSQETVYEILRKRHAKDGEDKSGWQQEALI